MPGRRFRIYSQAFKVSAVRRVLAGEKIRAVARELGLGHLLYTWLDHYEQGGPDVLIPRGRPRRCPALLPGNYWGRTPNMGVNTEPALGASQSLGLPISCARHAMPVRIL